MRQLSLQRRVKMYLSRSVFSFADSPWLDLPAATKLPLFDHDYSL